MENHPLLGTIYKELLKKALLLNRLFINLSIYSDVRYVITLILCVELARFSGHVIDSLCSVFCSFWKPRLVLNKLWAQCSWICSFSTGWKLSGFWRFVVSANNCEENIVEVKTVAIVPLNKSNCGT